MARSLTLNLAWGGYYSSKSDDGTYGVFRLLDINKDAVNYALYSQKFDHEPTPNELKGLKPSIGHAPIAAASLFNDHELKLIHAEPLIADDLEGYVEYYLKDMGMPDDMRPEFKQKLIEFSQQPPVRVKITEKEDGSVDIEDAN